ncbi:hypothetical protein, partial [Halorubrum sp. Atlit-26R]|uniref:hypothetical protein n=1 Tax=Halorubrum sp. Atlit-26R TaxID=2282128 RepID=UPI0018F315EB
MTPDDEANETADVLASNFIVESIETNVSDEETFVEGDAFNVTTTINNTGQLDDATQSVSFSAPGFATDEEVTLDAGETETLNFTYTTEAIDESRSVEAEVSTEDDANTTTVNVTAQQFLAVTNLDGADTVERGE